MRLLNLELADRPEHPFTLFNLGMTCSHADRYEEAVDYLERGIARSGADESHLRKAFGLLVYALMKLGRRAEAWEASPSGRRMFSRDTELRFREGVLLHDLGRLAESRQAYLDVLSGTEERHFSSVDSSLKGFKLRQNMAVLALDMGNLDEAEGLWREVVREAPRYRHGWRGLTETLLKGGRVAVAESVADELIEQEDLLRLEGLLIKSRVAVRLGRFAEARDALDRATALRADDLATLRGRCEFFFQHGEAGEAERSLVAMIARDPGDACSYHNLGIVMMRDRRHHEAVAAYQRSLSLRPDYAATYLNLGYTQRDSGRIDEAIAAWEQVLRLMPGEPTALAELAALRNGVTT